MSNFPDLPGKSLITGMTKHTRVVVGAAAAGTLAVGGFVVKRVLGHGGEGDGESAASADPIAETPTAPPGAEEKPVPKSKPAKPKPPKPKPPKVKAEKPDAGSKPKPPKPKEKAPKAAKAKPAKPKAPKPKVEPGDQTGGKDPHHALNSPVVDDPDMTEYPDPYDTREDPRDPIDPDGAPFGEEPHPQTGAESTSEPPLSQDPEVENSGKPPRRDNLDD
jgi:hypothetical protein